MSGIFKVFFFVFSSFINPSYEEPQELCFEDSYEFCFSNQLNESLDSPDFNLQEEEEIQVISDKLLRQYLKNGGDEDFLNHIIKFVQETKGKEIYSGKDIVEYSGQSLMLNLYNKESLEFRSYWFNFEKDSLIVVKIGGGTGNRAVKNSLEGKTILGIENNSYLTPYGFFIADVQESRFSKTVGANVIPIEGITYALTLENSKHQKFRLPSNYNSSDRGILIHASKNKNCPLNTSKGCLTLDSKDYSRFKKFFQKDGDVLIVNYGSKIALKGKKYTVLDATITIKSVEEGVVEFDY